MVPFIAGYLLQKLNCNSQITCSYEVVSKIFRTGAAIYTAVVVAQSTGRLSSESVCQVRRSWVDVGSFHMRLFGVVYVTCGDFHDGSERGTESEHQSVVAVSGETQNGCHPHPPHCPDLASCDFFLLSKMKLKL
jgi:hypothetical protein